MIHPKSYKAALVGIDNPLSDKITEEDTKGIGNMITALGDALEAVGNTYIETFPNLSFFISSKEDSDTEFYLQVKIDNDDFDSEEFSNLEKDIIEEIKNNHFTYDMSESNDHGYFINFET